MASQETANSLNGLLIILRVVHRLSNHLLIIIPSWPIYSQAFLYEQCKPFFWLYIYIYIYEREWVSECVCACKIKQESKTANERETTSTWA